MEKFSTRNVFIEKRIATAFIDSEEELQRCLYKERLYLDRRKWSRNTNYYLKKIK